MLSFSSSGSVGDTSATFSDDASKSGRGVPSLSPRPWKEATNLAKNDKKENNSEIGKAEHRTQLPRLRRIEGQVRGLQKMIESERNCLDITHQISAIINALRRVQNDMLHEHLAALGTAIVEENLSPQKRRELAEEIAAHLKRLT